MSDQKTVLIVEDEKNIVDILRFNLQRSGYAILEAYDGEDGLKKALSANPDLILLDVMLPKMNGFDVCKALREKGSNVPVIILTAREEESDKVLGLEIGADDYITKPFSMRELVARVGANIRRTSMTAPAAASAAASAMQVSGDLSINTDSHQVFRAGKAIDLTQREYELLTFLASHPNKVYSRTDLMEQVWNYGYVGDDVENILLRLVQAADYDIELAERGIIYIDEMDKIAKETLDDTFRTALSGDSKEYRESSSSLMFAFILAILLIYLILAAQFESFKDPLIIMLTVPLAIAGALVFMYFGDITMNIFSQIGIIMLIGLVAKNGILIVEFANQKQEAGEDKMSAIKDAALQRLRPILMTSASTVLGLSPLAFATGEGCNQRIAMGTAVVGGMVVSTLLTMYIVPAIYSYISTYRIKKLTE